MSSATIEFSVPAIRDTTGPPHFSLGYSPALDGVRGIAILAVLAVHTNHLFGWSLLPGGNIGVDIFFTLSGYLITRLLLEEWKRAGSINLWNFYWRRILRLVPALLLLVTALYFFGSRVFPPAEAEQTNFGIPIALTYASDLMMAFSSNVRLGALQHTWSLGIEEHFYLIWPLIMILALRAGVTGRKLFLAVLIMGSLAAIERIVLSVNGATALRTYYGIDVRSDALLIGCASGVAVSWGLVRSLPGFTIPVGVLLILLALTTNFATPFMHQGGFTLVALATAILLINAVSKASDTLRGVLEFGPLIWIGKISYGVYLWHYPVFRSVGHLHFAPATKLFVATAITFAVSSASFYLIEKRVLLLKTRFS